MPGAEVDAAIDSMSGGQARSPQLTIMPLTGGFARRRPCPRCDVAMIPCTLAAIPIDRCDAHGLWFDHDELARVLYAAAPEAPRNGDGPLVTAGGVVDGAGTLLDILEIFLP